MDEDAEYTKQELWVIDRIAEFVARYPGALWGPAHIVLEDKNLDSGYVEGCLQDTVNTLVIRSGLCVRKLTIDDHHLYPDHSLEELAATADFLAQMLRWYTDNYELPPWSHW